MSKELKGVGEKTKMRLLKLNIILVGFTLIGLSMGDIQHAYAEQLKADIAIEKAESIRSDVEAMMKRSKQYDEDIAQLIQERNQIKENINTGKEQSEILITKYEKLSNLLQKINFDKTLELGEWRELSQEARRRMEDITQQQAKILNRLKIQTRDLEDVEKELAQNIKQAKHLDAKKKIAFKEWELAQEQAKKALNNTATAAGGR